MPIQAENDPVAAVRRYIDAFNNGDEEAMAACFASPSTILDGMAPHVWRGTSAPGDWYRDVLTEGKHAGASNYAVALGEALHADVSADAAYVVFPATMTFDLQGTPVTQSGARFTTALSMQADGWRIAAWAWSKGTISTRQRETGHLSSELAIRPGGRVR
jgi:ketosteroid isomerase-like protein